MFEKIPAPVKGQPARASWGAALTNRVNELCAMAPARGLARDGLTGTGFAALPSNRRERLVAKIPGCFEIRRPSPAASGNDEGGFSLINRYYYVGSKVYELEENRTYYYKDTFVCLIIDMSGPTCSASVDEFQSITSLRNAVTENENTYIVPLYHIGHNFEVLCDMRNIPGAASWEFDA